ncbi:uncharacterized protein EAE97_008778 [Botrytis byssoidea]|uniref:Uncharacterized protein n=1 Tax=Botrytis byssoidea TaxID=139641 RepID=A0A9P5IFV5_9HELO|nr:uncharacterized protein EAE97_008778 [Botrytis byssoidea]KAF7933011.1 hypothetical protein EAE97_008778 [Botrytis byssoidea]
MRVIRFMDMQCHSPPEAKSLPPTHVENYLDASESNPSSSKVEDSIFVQVGDDRGHRTEARNHVMRWFWREKKLQMTKKARVP